MDKDKPALAARATVVPASPIRKLIPLADAAKKRGIHVYHLNIGQPDIPSPEAFLKALGTYPHDVIAYGRSEGEANLREAYQRYYASYGIDLQLSEIMVTTSGSEALLFTFFLVASPGDEIVVFEPFYTNYNGFAAIMDVKLKPVATEAVTGYHLPDAAVIEKAIGPRTRAIAICNPNNPTGTVYTLEELHLIADLARRHNLFIISDEVYREFVYDGLSHTSMLQIKGVENRVVVTDSISKRFSACGARIGCIVSRNADFLAATMRLCQARLSPPVVEEWATVAALNLPREAYIKPMIQKFESRRDCMLQELAKIPGVVIHKPSGAFYLAPQFPVDDAEKFVSWMLQDFSLDGATTMLAPAAGFYATPGRGLNEARIAYVLNEDDLRKATACLAAGLAAYPGRKV